MICGVPVIDMILLELFKSSCSGARLLISGFK